MSYPAAQFVVPGWRVGWIVFQDRAKVATDVSLRQGRMALFVSQHRLLFVSAQLIMPSFAATQILKGIYNLSQIVLGANSLVQSVIPTLLQPAPGSAAEQELREFHTRYVRTLEENAHYVRTRVAEIPGLNVMVPEGAMYAMVSPSAAVLAAVRPPSCV